MTLHMYCYAAGNPVLIADPSGRQGGLTVGALICAIALAIIVGGIVGGFTAYASGADVGKGIFLGILGALLFLPVAILAPEVALFFGGFGAGGTLAWFLAIVGDKRVSLDRKIAAGVVLAIALISLGLPLYASFGEANVCCYRILPSEFAESPTIGRPGARYAYVTDLERLNKIAAHAQREGISFEEAAEEFLMLPHDLEPGDAVIVQFRAQRGSLLPPEPDAWVTGGVRQWRAPNVKFNTPQGQGEDILNVINFAEELPPPSNGR
jgi:hypothetical protein